MLLPLLALCLGVACSAQNPEYAGITTAPAEGSTSLPCGHYSSGPAPLVLKLQMEERSNDSWVMVGMSAIVRVLDTSNLSLLLTPDNKNTSRNFSCSVDDAPSHAPHRGKVRTNMAEEWITCHARRNWTKVEWSREGEVIAMVDRVRPQLNVRAARTGPSFIFTSIIEEDSRGVCCHRNRTIKRLNATCRGSPQHSNATGWELFLDGKYWIIVAVASSSVLLYLLLVGCLVGIKRRRRARRRPKNSFFKMSSAARNLYTGSINPETDVALKDQDFTYQNMSMSPPKVVTDDCFSDKSSFESVGGDSYLEPEPDGGDRASDGGSCYEDPTEDPDNHADSIDGDCYENTNEQMKDGSIGSQSYEDMKGSICLRTTAEAPPDEGATQDEDADSYENMQNLLYAQPTRVLHPPHKEDQTEGRKANPANPSTHQSQKVSTELQGQNGDFYISYENSKL
ncbi:B-lymphocyte antigen CD19 isoform 2-T2 [Anomaloglossus baeobatrachus]|uniref:B-lymphocyte antigen CD19 isoform X2 n=1 Tax=Anomaloglossus baeobatrachus TaxID=238106 RepID=UPI003F4F4C97